MNQFTTDLVQALVQKEDVTKISRSHLENAVNTLLASELTAFLDYEKYDGIGFNTGNSRNGSYERTLHTVFGELHLVIPRDQNGDFKQQTVASYKRANDTLEAFVIHMFQKGVTTAEICEDFKSVYRAESLEMGQQALHSFIEKWKSKYPKVTKPLLNNSYLFTFYSFPKSIWRSIYSTNLIESFNKQIKKYSKRKEQFPNEESLERFLVSQFDQYNQRFATRCHIGFDQARAELQMMFKTN